MRKYIYIALLFLLCAGRVSAQFTLVSGTVTDSNGLAYSCGTISASIVNLNGQSLYLNGVQFSPSPSATKLGCPTDPSTSTTPGAFTVQLADNAQLKCGSGASIVTCATQTQWLFLVNSAGIPPPAGTGPQTCTATLTITGASQSVISSFSACPILSKSLGGNSASPKGTTDAGSSTIYLTDPKYNFPGITQWSCQAGITNASNIVTLPAGDRVFTGSPTRNAQVGDVMWAANANCGGEGTIQVPLALIARGTIISVDSATQVHVSNTSSATCTVVNKDNCVFVWGPDATTSLQSAWNDTANACGTLVLPAGGILTLLPPTNTTSGCPPAAGGNDVGSALSVRGQGGYVTMLFTPPSPASWNNSMFASTGSIGPQRKLFHDFGIASFAGAPAVLAGKTGFDVSFYGSFYNVFLLDWYPCDNISCANTFIPVNINGVGNASAYAHDNICLNSGSQSGCINGANGAVLTHNALQNTNTCLQVGSSGAGNNNYSSENSAVLCGIQGSIVFGSSGAGTTYSTNDTFNGLGTSLPCVKFIAPQTVFFKDVTMSCTPTVSGSTLNIPASVTVSIEGSHSSVFYSNGNAGNGPAIVNAGTLTLRNTAVSVTGTGNALTNSGTVTFKEGNSFAGGNITNTGVFQIVPGEGGFQGACTGVVTSATTVGLYNLGQTTATTCTNTVVGNGQVASKPGTVYALYCTATAGNQAADACTLVKNGVAQTMTCSLNGVSSCTDGTSAHWNVYSAGDILSVEAIAGAATTLANVKGLIVAQ